MNRHAALLVAGTACLAISLAAAPPAAPAREPGAGSTNPRSSQKQPGGKAGKAAQPLRGGTEPAGEKGGVGHRFGREHAPPKTPGAIRIGTYNMLNLFDHVDDPKLSGDADDMKLAISDDRAKALAAAIKELDADVLALHEVESLEALTWFRDTYLKGLGYDHIASKDVGNPRGIESSVISRFPIVETKTFVDMDLTRLKREGTGWTPKPASEPAGAAPGRRGAATDRADDAASHEQGRRFQRSPLLVTIKGPDGYMLTVIALHHKASKGFDYQRESEALGTTAIARDLLKEDPSRNIVIMGDFNSAPWDKSIRTYLENGFVDTLDYRTTDKQNPESRLYRTHESERVFDYILLDSAAFREFVPGSAFVLGTLFPGDSYDYTKDTPPPGYASDHYPVAIDLMPRDLR
ncbi:MAG: endonuclease/exonuclease/phosphatase family protein [Phycisphaerales bacterium]